MVDRKYTDTELTNAVTGPINGEGGTAAQDFEPSLQNAESNWENLTEGPDQPLENVPDAEDLSPNSPVDPAAPAELLHGIDLLNGSDGDEDAEIDSDEILDSSHEG